MEVMNWCLIIVLTIATVQCSQDDGIFEVYADEVNGRAGHEVEQINLNKWFDRCLPLMQTYAVHEKLEPMSLPDMILPVITEPESNVKLSIKNGLVYGTTNVTRSGDIILYKYPHSWQLDMQLNWHDIEVTCDYTLEYLVFKRKGSLEGRFHAMNVAMLVSVDLEKRKVYLRFLKIVDAGEFSIQLHGHLIDPIVNTAVKTIMYSFKKRILHEIESQMYNAAQLKIDELNEWLANHTSLDIPNLPYQLIQLQL